MGRLAAVGFMVWPTALRYNATLYSDPVALVCFIWFLIAFQRAAMRGDENGAPSWGRWLLAGGVLALCVEMKPLYLLYTPIAFLLAFLLTIVEAAAGWKGLDNLLIPVVGFLVLRVIMACTLAELAGQAAIILGLAISFILMRFESRPSNRALTGFVFAGTLSSISGMIPF